MQMRGGDHLRVVRDPGHHGSNFIGVHPVGFARVFSLMPDGIVGGVGKGLSLGGEIRSGRHVSSIQRLSPEENPEILAAPR